MRLTHRCIARSALGICAAHHYLKLMKLRDAIVPSKTNQEEMIMNIARSFTNWRKYRQTINELGRMSNRELSDLGINRSEIPYVARQAVGK